MRFLILLLLVISCSKKSGTSSGFTSDQFIGRWKLISSTSDKPYDWNNTGTPSTTVNVSCSDIYTFEFDKGGTGFAAKACGLTASGLTWVFQNDSLESQFTGWATFRQGVVSVNETSLTTQIVTQAPNLQFYNLTDIYAKVQ